MSQGLQDKFGAMEQAWAQSRTPATRSESSPSEAVASAAAAASASEQEDSQQQRESKKRKVAMDTAFAIESEVEKWQRGIAELEAMLEAANGDVEDFQGSSSSSSLSEGEARARPPEVVRFPSLPPIIPAEEGDLEGSEEEEEDDDDESDNQAVNNGSKKKDHTI